MVHGIQALERAGLRCRELEDQLKVRQESLRTVQAESVVLETQLQATQTEQEQLQLNLRKAEASNAVLAQRLSSVDTQQREAASSTSPRVQQPEATKVNLVNLERVASALRASTQEEAEARARFEQAIARDAKQMNEAAHCTTRRAVSAEADVAEQSVRASDLRRAWCERERALESSLEESQAKAAATHGALAAEAAEAEAAAAAVEVAGVKERAVEKFRSQAEEIESQAREIARGSSAAEQAAAKLAEERAKVKQS